MLNPLNLISKIFKSSNQKELDKLGGIVEKINVLEEKFSQLENIDFPINIIKRFYLFESKRWDIQTIDNKKIKLPIEKFEESLKNFLEIKNKENFEKYNIFDYRINDQLILK